MKQKQVVKHHIQYKTVFQCLPFITVFHIIILHTKHLSNAMPQERNKKKKKVTETYGRITEDQENFSSSEATDSELFPAEYSCA